MSQRPEARMDDVTKAMGEMSPPSQAPSKGGYKGANYDPNYRNKKNANTASSTTNAPTYKGSNYDPNYRNKNTNYNQGGNAVNSPPSGYKSSNYDPNYRKGPSNYNNNNYNNNYNNKSNYNNSTQYNNASNNQARGGYQGKNYNPNKTNNYHDNKSHSTQSNRSQGFAGGNKNAQPFSPRETSNYVAMPSLPPRDMMFQYDSVANTYIQSGPHKSLVPVNPGTEKSLPPGIIAKVLPDEYYVNYEQYMNQMSEFSQDYDYDDEDEDEEFNADDLAHLAQFEAEIAAESATGGPISAYTDDDDENDNEYLVGDSEDEEEAAAKFDWFPASAKCQCCKGYIRNCAKKDPKCIKKCACDALKMPLVFNA